MIVSNDTIKNKKRKQAPGKKKRSAATKIGKAKLAAEGLKTMKN